MKTTLICTLLTTLLAACSPFSTVTQLEDALQTSSESNPDEPSVEGLGSGFKVDESYPAPTQGRVLNVATYAELKTAVLSKAAPGDVITLAPGTYTIPERLYLSRAGKADQRITVRASRLGDVKIKVSTSPAFQINAPHWTFENLDIQGVCNVQESCEHAFHILGYADGTIIRNNRIYDFSSHIKANVHFENGLSYFPDDVRIEANRFYNTSLRNVNAPVNVLNFNGGQRYVIRGNVFSDFGRVNTANSSAGVYLKGGSGYGLVERNLVVCRKRIQGGNDVRGIQIGDFTQVQYCEGDCANLGEHQNGIVRNNIVINCPCQGNSSGYHLSNAANIKVYNNTVFGEKNNFIGKNPPGTTYFRNNITTGPFVTSNPQPFVREGELAGTSTAAALVWFSNPALGDFNLKDGSKIVDRALPLPEVTTDFCGRTRGSKPDVGAIEYSTGFEVCIDYVRRLYESI